VVAKVAGSVLISTAVPRLNFCAKNSPLSVPPKIGLFISRQKANKLPSQNEEKAIQPGANCGHSQGV